MSGTPTVAERWSRFGYDRLYVTGPAGDPLGWADLATGSIHPASSEHASALNQAVDDWRAALPPDGRSALPPVAASVAAPPASVSGTAPVLVPEEPTEPWADLATNAPGAAARAQALSLRNSAPIRTFFARLVNLKTPERGWRIGADGEEMVAAELARLVRRDPRWRVLHAIPVGTRGSDIDHLVIGPGGVFTLNSKHHPGAAVWVGGDAVLVNGHRHPYVRNSRHEAGRAAKLLTAASGIPVSVSGLIVPIGARRITVKTAPADVAVVPRRRIFSWLHGRSPVLDEQTVTAIFAVARRSTTWQPSRR